MKKIALLLSLFSFNALAYEVTCVGEIFSFTIEVQEDFKVGTISVQRQALQRVAMTKKSVKAPEYENLKALYTGITSTDSFELYIFKEKENKSHISFLQIESKIGSKKVIELRCNL